MTKSEAIVAYIQRNPSDTAKHIAKRYGVSVSLVYKLRKDAAAPAQEPVAAREPKARDIQIGGDHYKNMGVEPWDVVDTWPTEQRIGYYRGNAVKYLMRMGTKDSSEVEIAKGQHYVQKLIEVLRGTDKG